MEEKKEIVRRKRGSIFGPLLLITIGVIFLLSNVGLIDGDAWELVTRLWPLLLIVIGLDSIYQREGFVGAIFIIGLGVVFLLGNLGMLNINVWQLALRLWPLLLIAFGIDLVIGRRSIWGALAGLVVLLALLAGALWFYGVRFQSGQALSGQEIRQALEGAKQAEINLDNGAGDVQVQALTGSNDLVVGIIDSSSSRHTVTEHSIVGDKAVFRLHENETIVVFGEQRSWDLNLTTAIPLDIRFNQGAGASDLDLSGMQVSALDISMGVGQTRLTLPADGNFSGKVNAAIGQIIVEVPDGMGVRIRASTALSNVVFPDGYQRSGDYYISPEYETAEQKIDLDLEIAIGNITIIEIAD